MYHPHTASRMEPTDALAHSANACADPLGHHDELANPDLTTQIDETEGQLIRFALVNLMAVLGHEQDVETGEAGPCVGDDVLDAANEFFVATLGVAYGADQITAQAALVAQKLDKRDYPI